MLVGKKQNPGVEWDPNVDPAPILVVSNATVLKLLLPHARALLADRPALPTPATDHNRGDQQYR